MIAFTVYLAAMLAFVLSGGGGLSRDPFVSRRYFALLLLGKAAAVPVFYFVYQRAYGGIWNFDAGKFFNDAHTLADYGRSHPGFLWRLFTGMQEDAEGTRDYREAFVRTFNWDNGPGRQLFYNDNRVVIRLHVLLDFLANGSYFAHALFSCFLSFAGIVWIFRALRDHLGEMPRLSLAVLCFFPALWFYCGAVQKEGPTLFVLGGALLLLKGLLFRLSLDRAVLFVLLAALGLVLKPYIIVTGMLFLGALLVTEKLRRRRLLAYSVAVALLGLIAFVVVAAVKGKSPVRIALDHQARFADAARGGIFLLDKEKFVRVEFDSSNVRRVGDSLFTIRAKVPYEYWKLTALSDTLRSSGNTDTVTTYRLVYAIARSRSNIPADAYPRAGVPLLFTGLYYSMAFPLFNAHGILQWCAAAENLVLLLALAVAAWGFAMRPPLRRRILAFGLFAVSVCIVAGISTPNSGAIFRYRAPAAPFLLLAGITVLAVRHSQRNEL